MYKCTFPNFLKSTFRYELRTSQFHYEANKNNQLMSSEPQWQELLDYRHRLVSASRESQNYADTLLVK